MTTAKVSIEKVAEEMFIPLAHEWVRLCHMLLPALQGAIQTPTAPRNLAMDALGVHTAAVLGCLGLFLRGGFRNLSRSPHMNEFMGALYVQIREMHRLLSSVINVWDSGGRMAEMEVEADQETEGEFDDGTHGLGVVLAGCRDGVTAAAFVARRLLKAMVALPTDIQDPAGAHQLPMGLFVGPFLELFHGLLLEEFGDSATGATVSASGAVGRGCIPEPASISCVLFLSRVLGCAEYTDNEEEVRRLTTSGRHAIANVGRRLFGGAAGPLGQAPVDTVGEDVRFQQELAAARAAHTAKTAFFTPARLESLLNMLFFRLLPPRAKDLALWSDDPSEYISSKASESATSTLPSSAEHLFMTLLELETTTVGARLGGMLQDSAQQLHACGSPPAPPATVLLWYSIYLCTGIGSYALCETMDLGQWLSTSLPPLMAALLRDPSAGSINGVQLLRQRFLWMTRALGHFLNEGGLRTLIAATASTMDPAQNSDVVVRMEAVLVLRNVTQLECFRPDMMSEGLVRLLESLCAFTMELEESEQRADVVTVIADIVHTMGTKLVPVLGAVAQHLGSLWSGDDDSSPLRPTILDTLRLMVIASGGDSHRLHHVVVPLIGFCMQPAANLTKVAAEGGDAMEAELSFLFSDGLSLWLAVMRNATAYSPEFGELYRQCIPLAFGSDITSGTSLDILNSDPEFGDLRNIMLLTEAYVMQGGAAFLADCGGVLELCLRKTFGNVRARDVPYLMRPLEAALLACRADGSRFIASSGILPMLLRVCCASATSVVHVQAAFRDDVHDDLTVACYASVVARCLLVDAGAVESACSALASEKGLHDAAHILMAFLRVLLDKTDSLGSLTGSLVRRKTWCMAILSRLPSPTAQVTQLLPEVMYMAAGVVQEEATDAAAAGVAGTIAAMVSSDPAGGQGGEYFSDGGNKPAEAGDPGPEQVVLKFLGLMKLDGPSVASLRDYAAAQTEAVRLAVGDAALAQLLVQVPAPELTVFGLGQYATQGNFRRGT
jgi:hypothetical protein